MEMTDLQFLPVLIRQFSSSITKVDSTQVGLMTNNKVSLMVQKFVESKASRLEGHLRVRYKPRLQNLVYHIEHGSGLKMNVDLGAAFLRHPKMILGRVERIADGCIQMYNGQRLASAIHLEESEE